MIFCVFCLGGCTQTSSPRFLWPAPPAEPRLEFIRAFSSEYELLAENRDRVLARWTGTAGEFALSFPFGVVGNGNEVLVVDQDSRTLRRYDLRSGKVAILAGPEVIKDPFDLEKAPDGTLFMVDEKRVLHLSATGTVLGLLGEGVLQNPAYLALDPFRERIYISDSLAHRIFVFGLDGQFRFAFGQQGRGEGELHGPQGLAVNGKGDIFVADYFNARVVVFDSKGQFVRQFGQRSNSVWGFEGPKDLAFDSEGHLFLVDSRKNALLTYTEDGSLLLMTGGGPGTVHPLGFNTPGGIDIDANDRIFISDRLNNRISVWQYLNPAYLENHPITEADLDKLQKLME